MKTTQKFGLLFIIVLVLGLSVVPSVGRADPFDDSANSCVALQYNMNTRVRSIDAKTNGEVSILQVFLNDQGLLNVDPTGLFDTATFYAVKAFQSANGLASDGSVGPITRAKIRAITCGNTSVPVPATPVPTPTSRTGTSQALCPNGNTIDSNCTSGPASSSPALCPNGFTVASNCQLAPVSNFPIDTTITPSYISSNLSAISGDTSDTAQGSFKFQIYSPSDDIQIYRSFPQRSLKVIFAGTGSSNADAGSPTAAILRATSGSSGNDSSQYYTVKKGDTRTFELTFVISPTSGSGLYRVKATSLYAFTKGVEIDFGSEFSTTNVYLRGQAVTPSINPYITSVTPSSGPVGTVVTVYGSNFGASNTVLFNGTIGNITSNGSSVQFTVPQNTPVGSYGVSVMNNANNYNSNTLIFSVTSGNSTNHAPTIVGFPAVQTNIQAGQTVNFSLTAKDADNDDLSWSSDWGEGDYGGGSCSTTRRRAGTGWNYNPSHTWNQAGTYNVRFTVSDCVGGSDTYSVLVSVGNLVDNTRKDTIYNYYRLYLARTPDDQGLNYYLNGGMTLDQIKSSILSSQEYKARREAIRQVYLELLKREPEEQGWTYWSDNGFTVGQMRSQTLSGYEYTTKQQIVALYVELLNRQPDDQGLNYYYNLMYVNHWTIDQVRENIKGGVECQGIPSCKNSTL